MLVIEYKALVDVFLGEIIGKLDGGLRRIEEVLNE